MADEEALPDIDPEVARQAAEFAWENGFMMAAPDTEQGSSGWYFDYDGSRSQCVAMLHSMRI